MLNNVCIMGRLTRDPELRTTGSGKSVASFSLAVERDFENEGKRDADFLDCVAWGKTGEFVSRNFTKGKLCCVTGRLQVRDWQDKDGNKRRATEIIVAGVYFCGDKTQTAPSGWSPAQTAPSGWSPAQPDFQLIEADEQMPF